ncbi:MAG TPA: ABC transporter permease [Thermomicrobiales bacterium]|jgi:putative spermidine/putrescine transport system permease protein|nr:ABC transporter permease [Thermomicrobiales bacterium]
MGLSRGQRIFRVVGGAVFALILIILYAPFLIMGILSFAERTTAVFPPSDFSFISYQKLFNPNDFSLYRIPGEPLVNYLRPIGLSVTLALLTSVLATTCAMMAALAFRERFPGRGAVFYALLLGMVTPGIILGLGFRLFADQISLPTGWRTTGLLTHIAWTMPFGFIVFLVFLNRFDRTIEEAAAVLGASAWTTFRTVTLPVLAPAVLASLLFGFTLSFDEIQRSSLVLGRDQTLPIAIIGATTVRITPVLYALGSLIALVSFALVAFYLLFFERERRRFYGTPVIEDEEETDMDVAPGPGNAEGTQA